MANFLVANAYYYASRGAGLLRLVNHGLRKLRTGHYLRPLPDMLEDMSTLEQRINCGFGGDAQAHRAVVRRCLEAVYPRLRAGAVCVLMDYHDKSSGDPGQDVNPGVKLACDDFLAGKPERVTALYGNQFSHSFFRKIT